MLGEQVADVGVDLVKARDGLGRQVVHAVEDVRSVHPVMIWEYVYTWI